MPPEKTVQDPVVDPNVTPEPEVRETKDGELIVPLVKDENTPEELDVGPDPAVKVETVPDPEGTPKPVVKPGTAKDDSRYFYQERKIQGLENTIKQMQDTINKPPEVKEPDPKDMEKLLQEDAQAGIKKIVDSSIAAALATERASIKTNEVIEADQTTKVKHAQNAIQLYPQLNDKSSEHAQVWFDVLDKNPRWKDSPDGPLLVMREMEVELRNRGYEIGPKTEKTPVPETEAQRLARISGTNVPASRPKTGVNEVILNADQKEFCELNGIDPKMYARNLEKSRGKEVNA